MIVTPAALDFYQALGGRAAIASYVEPLVEWAADMLAEALGTFRMQVPKSMEAPFMRLVGKLPPVTINYLQNFRFNHYLMMFQPFHTCQRCFL